MRCEARLRIFTSEQKTAKAIQLAFEGLEGGIKKRADSRISLDKNKVIVDVTAEDAVALRASLNGYLRQLQAIEAVEENK